jgi:hypothetical protein
MGRKSERTGDAEAEVDRGIYLLTERFMYGGG